MLSRLAKRRSTASEKSPEDCGLVRLSIVVAATIGTSLTSLRSQQTSQLSTETGANLDFGEERRRVPSAIFCEGS